MSYIGLNLDNLVWELKSLMENNFGEETTKTNFEEHFLKAKESILETFKDIIEQNKPEVFNELFEEEEEN